MIRLSPMTKATIPSKIKANSNTKTPPNFDFIKTLFHQIWTKTQSMTRRTLHMIFMLMISVTQIWVSNTEELRTDSQWIWRQNIPALLNRISPGSDFSPEISPQSRISPWGKLRPGPISLPQLCVGVGFPLLVDIALDIH